MHEVCRDCSNLSAPIDRINVYALMDDGLLTLNKDMLVVKYTLVVGVIQTVTSC